MCFSFFSLRSEKKIIFEMFGFLLVIQPALNGRNNLTGTFSASDQKEMLMWIGFNLHKKKKKALCSNSAFLMCFVMQD